MPCAKRNRLKSPSNNAWFWRNNSRLVAVTSASPKVVVIASSRSVSSIVCKFCPRSCERVKKVSSLWPYHWEMLDCRGSFCWLLIQSPSTVPNVSSYMPDYMFQTVIGVRGGHLKTSRLSNDLQDGRQILA